MKAFEIDRTLTKIVAVTPVPEFKGEKRDHGVSVTFERMFDNTILDEFDPDLRAALYKAEDGKPKADDNGQGEFAMPVQGLKLTARKCLSIQMPMKLRKDLSGWSVVYHRGASEQSDVKAGDVKFSDFTLVDACEGGSVMLRFKAYQKLQPEVQGYVDHMAQTEVECTFRQPEKTQSDLVDEANKASKRSRKKTAAEKIAEEGDPLAGSDLAQDHTRIDPSVPMSAEAWPFPAGARPADESDDEGEVHPPEDAGTAWPNEDGEPVPEQDEE